MPPVKTNWNESERKFYTILNLLVLFKGKKRYRLYSEILEGSLGNK